LDDHGYFWEYKRRTREKLDGCLTAFKKSKFELQESKYIEFFVHEDEVVLNRDNIAQILVLKTKFLAPMSNNPVLLFVLNTHLLFNLRRGEIKAA
jgi:protein angel